MTRPQAAPAVDVQIETRGGVPPEFAEHATEKLHAVIRRLGEPVLAARVTLTLEANHAVTLPAAARAVIDLNGRPVQAHAAAATMNEAIDLLQDRLSSRLSHLRRGHRPHDPITPAP